MKRQPIPIVHLSATKNDLVSRQPGGRFFFIPGSPRRAKLIADRFERKQIFPSERGHDIHIGVLNVGGTTIDVGAVSTGMGCPSLGIVVNELVMLGVKRFLRIGTAGSLCPKVVKAGDTVISTGAVRDEGASCAYGPLGFPAIASFPMVNALIQASCSAKLKHPVHIGIVHSKDSLHAREFLLGPMRMENDRYMKTLSDLGVLASEMEASHLFVLGGALSDASNGFVRKKSLMWKGIETGCVLAILGDETPFVASSRVQSEAIEQAIEIGIQSLRFLFPA